MIFKWHFGLFLGQYWGYFWVRKFYRTVTEESGHYRIGISHYRLGSILVVDECFLSNGIWGQFWDRYHNVGYSLVLWPIFRPKNSIELPFMTFIKNDSLTFPTLSNMILFDRTKKLEATRWRTTGTTRPRVLRIFSNLSTLNNWAHGAEEVTTTTEAPGDYDYGAQLPPVPSEFG